MRALQPRSRHSRPRAGLTQTSPSDLAPLTILMAKNRQGPRQPLSQRRPKVAVGKKVSAPSAKLMNSLAKMSVPAKRARKVVRHVAPDAGLVYDRLLALYPDAHCELDFKTPFQLLVA